MNKERANSVVDAYSTRYACILDKIWPSINSNGFDEHNQTVNFLIAYETVAAKNGEQISTWSEFQIANGNKNNNHIDGLIINHTKKELYFVESKRFSLHNEDDKRLELGADFARIQELDLNNRFEKEKLFAKKESISEYKTYGILLFDLWTQRPWQKDLLEKWKKICEKPSSKALSEFFNSTDSNIDCDDKDLLPIVREIVCDRWRNEDYSYFLGTLIWKKRT